MIASWISKLAGTLGIKLGLAKILFWALAAIALVSLLSIGKCTYDRSVVEKHDLEQRADAAEADRDADREITAQERADADRLRQEEVELKRVQDNEVSDVDRRLAKHRCLRLQQSARAAGREPPRC